MYYWIQVRNTHKQAGPANKGLNNSQKSTSQKSTSRTITGENKKPTPRVRKTKDPHPGTGRTQGMEQLGTKSS